MPKHFDYALPSDNTRVVPMANPLIVYGEMNSYKESTLPVGYLIKDTKQTTIIPKSKLTTYKSKKKSLSKSKTSLKKYAGEKLSKPSKRSFLNKSVGKIDNGQLYITPKKDNIPTDGDRYILDLENSNNSFDKAMAQAYKDTGLVPDITKSATPMDNTIMTYNTPYGVKSVWIPTPELEMKIGQPKPPLKWYDYIPTAAMAIPSAVALWPAAKAAGTYALLHPVEMIGSTLSGYVGSKTVDLATSSASDGKYPTWGHFVTDNGRRAPVWLGEFSNPGAAVGGYAGFKWGLGAEKRLAETFMRTTENVNPLPTIKFNWSVMEPGHKKSIINYILFNAKDKTYPYNTFAFTKPRAYTGIFHGPKNLQGDVIDAFLYGKPLDSAIGTLKSKGSGFGPYELYIRNNYQNKAKDIPVYELNVPEGPLYVDDLVDGSIVVSNKHSITRPIELKHGDYDAAGHYIVEGVDLNNTTNKYLSEWDIWKFNSKDYLNRYNVADGNPIKKLGLKWGLDFIDSHGTPIIVRTPWSK